MRILPSLTYILIGAVMSACAAQETAKPPAALNLEEVVKLVRAGITEELVIARIKRYNKSFDLNSDEILELKKQGVSDSIIGYLMDPAKPYAPPPPAPPAAPESKPQSAPPKDPLTLKVPPEPGLYWLASTEQDKEAFELIELKPLVPMKAGGKIALKLTGGLKKGQTVGFLVGPRSRLRASNAANVFYGRLGAKTAIEDVVLLRAEKGDGKRIIDFGPKPAKPVFPPESIKPFASKALAEGLYRLDVAPLAPGEYVLLILGSGDEKKGILGKGYDFAVDPPAKGK